jgi:predicted Zn-dependent protease
MIHACARNRSAGLALIVAVFLISCGPAYTPPQAQSTDLALARFDQATVVPERRDRSLGDEAAMVMRAKERLQPAAQDLCIQNRGRRCRFRVHIIDDTATINAVASGSGQIDIYRGLIQLMPGEAELAFIVAHEMAHHIAGHLIEDPVEAGLGEALGGAAFGLVGVMLGTDLTTLKGIIRDGEMAGSYWADGMYQPRDEYEADYVGLYLMARAGYELDAAVRVMDLLAAQHEDGQPILFFASHPGDDDRSARLRRAIIEIEAKREMGAPLWPNR